MAPQLVCSASTSTSESDVKTAPAVASASTDESEEDVKTAVVAASASIRDGGAHVKIVERPRTMLQQGENERKHKHHDHAAGCSSTHPNLEPCAFDLLASPCKPLACPDVVCSNRVHARFLPNYC